MGRLDGRVAIVTGGGRGIGQGIAQVLASEGAAIVIADIDLDNANRTAEELQLNGRKAMVVAADVTSAASCEGAVQVAVAWLGRVHVLVNNAGVLGRHVGREVSEDDWDMTHAVNVKGIWHMSSAVIPHFKANGGGRIVNIASIAGRKGGAGMAHYHASKAAAINLTQSLAADFGRYNINVNAVCPGLLWTDMWRSIEALVTKNDAAEAVERRRVFEEHLARNCPLGREQTPEDIGHAVAFLASDAARNITGQALNVDGGLEMN